MRSIRKKKEKKRKIKSAMMRMIMTTMMTTMIMTTMTGMREIRTGIRTGEEIKSRLRDEGAGFGSALADNFHAGSLYIHTTHRL